MDWFPIYLHSYLDGPARTPSLNICACSEPSHPWPRSENAACCSGCKNDLHESKKPKVPGRLPFFVQNAIAMPSLFNLLFISAPLRLSHTPASSQTFRPTAVQHIAQQTHMLQTRLRLATRHLLLRRFLLLLLQSLRRAHLPQMRVLGVQHQLARAAGEVVF